MGEGERNNRVEGVYGVMYGCKESNDLIFPYFGPMYFEPWTLLCGMVFLLVFPVGILYIANLIELMSERCW